MSALVGGMPGARAVVCLGPIAVLAALLAAAAPARAVPNTARATSTYATTNRTLSVKDPTLGETYARTYTLHAPTTKPATPVPLLLGFHGQSGTGWEQEGQRAFDPLAEASGWAIAYLDGMGDGNQGTGWNCGTGGDNSTCVAGTTPSKVDCYDSCRKLGKCGRCNWNTCYDDAAYVEVVVAELVHELNVDARRVFAFGGSNGGMAIHYLIQTMPGFFLGVLPAYGLPLLGYATGGPDQRLLRHAERAVRTSILQYHDRGDDVIPWQGGKDTDGWLYETLEVTLATWAAIKDCDATPTNVSTPISGGAQHVACAEYANCALGYVRWCYYDGGHGAWPPPPAAEEYAWSFFQTLAE